MEILFNYFGELQHPEIMSFILIILAFGDTLTALMWRNEKKIAIFSKSLWVGFALNAFGSSVPYLISRIPILDPNDLFVNTVLTLWTLVFGFATWFSLVANYKLYRAKSYEMLTEVVPQILKAEIENKIKKHIEK